MPRHPLLVIGHRGAPGYRPEHTRSSYELALAAGVDAVEPDVVFTKDGVAVVRHENEIGSTTDVATRPEFAARRTRRAIDGDDVTGWFTEDFTWDELATLRCRERLPRLRPASAAHDDTEPVLRLRDLLDLVRAAGQAQARPIGVVLEVKHATHFGGLGFDVAGLLAAELAAAGWDAEGPPLTIESFEQTILAELRHRGVAASSVYLLEDRGRPFDLVSRHGRAAPRYADQRTPAGLRRLAGEVDGISLDKNTVLATPDVVAQAHGCGLRVFVWTCRPENRFLASRFRRGQDAGAFGDWEGEWAVLAETGVDGVFVDHPDLGVAFFGRPGGGG